MKALRKQTFRTLFFPPEKPTEKELTVGRRRFIEEGAVAAVIYSIATGNFLVGYLSYLGASVSFCALVAMIPNFGCVLQFFSPFLFERMHNRKLAIWILCLIYRLPLGMMMLLPAFLPDPGTVRILTVVLYTVSFLSAGMVTPGLQHMSLGLAPEGAKGRFFALKDIVCSCVNSGMTLLLGWQLDHFNAKGEFYTGFFIIGIVCLLLAVLDAVLLALVRENPVEFVSRLHVSDLLIPVKDQKFRPVFFYSVLAGLFSGLASPFLSVYEVRILGLSHTFITGVGVVSGIAAMAGSWFWGRYAEHLEPGGLDDGAVQFVLYAWLVVRREGFGTFCGAGADGACGGLHRRLCHRIFQPGICQHAAQREDRLHRHHGGDHQPGVHLFFGGCDPGTVFSGNVVRGSGHCDPFCGGCCRRVPEPLSVRPQAPV